MGERTFKPSPVATATHEAMQHVSSSCEPEQSVKTLGGRLRVRWDPSASATPMGQLAFFSEFLKLTGLFDQWANDCPLHYTSPNASSARSVLGSWMFSALAGHTRYAHLNFLRGDCTGAAILGVSRIISDDALRRALQAIVEEPERAQSWMRSHLLESVRPALGEPWILDIDTTIKTLYGHQEGAQVSYNPHKHGRPSHAIHTYWMSNLRMVLDAAVRPGKEHSAAQTLPGLLELLQRLSANERPSLVRGDCAFGNAPFMDALEQIEQPYLFKLRHSTNVKKLVQRRFGDRGWQDAGQGWTGREEWLKLAGWSQERRVIVLRRRIKGDILLTDAQGKPIEEPDAKVGQAEIKEAVEMLEDANSRKAKNRAKKRTKEAAAKAAREKQVIALSPRQQVICFGDDVEAVVPWEYAVLVTNTPHSIDHLAQTYRDRADCENGFDELKNQWGLTGFSTQDIERCELSARGVSLVYNWWSWYARLAKPEARMEGRSSRPLLLAAVGHMTSHAGGRELRLTSTHAEPGKIKALIANIQAGLRRIEIDAPQLEGRNRLRALIAYIIEKFKEAKRRIASLTPLEPPLCPG